MDTVPSAAAKPSWDDQPTGDDQPDSTAKRQDQAYERHVGGDQLTAYRKIAPTTTSAMLPPMVTGKTSRHLGAASPRRRIGASPGLTLPDRDTDSSSDAMVPVRVDQHPLIARAGLVWGDDLPRHLQQLLSIPPMASLSGGRRSAGRGGRLLI